MITPITLNQFCIDKDIEICGVSYSTETHKQFLILTCYRSPTGNLNVFCKNIENVLNLLWKANVKIILIGDFNLDPTRDYKKYKILKNILSTYNLKNIINMPTRENYILDHIYMSEVSNFHIINNYISDHRTIFFNFLNLNTPANINKQILRRNFNKNNIEAFCQDIENENWLPVYKEINADLCFNNFHEIFMFYFEKHFPKKIYNIQKLNIFIC